MLKLLLILNLFKFILLVPITDPGLNDKECGKWIGTSPGWVAKVNYKKVYNKCLANLLNKDWLLSSASCFFDYEKPENYTIHLKDEPLPRPVSKIVRLPKYNPTLGAGFDIALIKLKSNVGKFTPQSGIKPICLPDYRSMSSFPTTNPCRYENSVETNLNVFTETFPDINLFEFKDCEHIYGDSVNEMHMLCAKSSQNQCVRVNASPLMCNDNKDITDRTWYLAAIASWPQSSSKCDKPGGPQRPDVFTKLYQNDYLKWITDTIKAN